MSPYSEVGQENVFYHVGSRDPLGRKTHLREIHVSWLYCTECSARYSLARLEVLDKICCQITPAAKIGRKITALWAIQ